MDQIYNVPIDVLMEIEAATGNEALSVASQLREQLPVALKDLLARFHIVGADLSLHTDSLREVAQPDVRISLFALDAHLALNIQDDDLTMVTELATDFCEETAMRLGPTFSKMKIKKHLMDIQFEDIALKSGAN